MVNGLAKFKVHSRAPFEVVAPGTTDEVATAVVPSFTVKAGAGLTGRRRLSPTVMLVRVSCVAEVIASATEGAAL